MISLFYIVNLFSNIAIILKSFFKALAQVPELTAQPALLSLSAAHTLLSLMPSQFCTGLNSSPIFLIN